MCARGMGLIALTLLQIMSVCNMALSKGVQAFTLCVNQSVNISPQYCKQGRIRVRFI